MEKKQMIDSKMQGTYQKICIDPLMRLSIFRKIHPTALTAMACLTGLCILPSLAFKLPILALFFLFCSGFLDTLDGSVARLENKTSNLGTVLDIVSDRIVECAVIIGLFLVEPTVRALPTLILLGSVLICVTSFLVVGIFTQNTSEKGFHYSPGLIERAEAFLFFALMILFPPFFIFLAYFFSFLVLLTALLRIIPK